MTMYSHCMFMYGYSDWGFSVLFPQLYGKCQGKTRKDGARPALFLIFVLFYVFLCCSMYCLFCDVLCIVCVYTCTVLLPPGGYPIAVKYIINIINYYYYYYYHHHHYHHLYRYVRLLYSWLWTLSRYGSGNILSWSLNILPTHSPVKTEEKSRKASASIVNRPTQNTETLCLSYRKLVK